MVVFSESTTPMLILMNSYGFLNIPIVFNHLIIMLITSIAMLMLLFYDQQCLGVDNFDGSFKPVNIQRTQNAVYNKSTPCTRVISALTMHLIYILLTKLYHLVLMNKQSKLAFAMDTQIIRYKRTP